MTGQPRYRELAAGFREQIERGRLKPGDQLPTEHEICAAENVSRHTAREALRLLVEAGLIQRRRGSGTVVADTPAPTFAQSITNFETIMQYARDAAFLPDVREAASQDLLEAFGLTGEYVRFEGLRQPADGAPIAATQIFVLADIAPDLGTVRDLDGSISEWLEANQNRVIARVTQRIEAVALESAAAGKLSAEPGSPALRTLRRYRDAEDRILILSESLHPAARFAFEMRLDRR
ncbi:MAG: GntR family transcriptional regulator [Pseudomonadota bacterium]